MPKGPTKVLASDELERAIRWSGVDPIASPSDTLVLIHDASAIEDYVELAMAHCPGLRGLFIIAPATAAMREGAVWARARSQMQVRVHAADRADSGYTEQLGWQLCSFFVELAAILERCVIWTTPAASHAAHARRARETVLDLTFGSCSRFSSELLRRRMAGRAADTQLGLVDAWERLLSSQRHHLAALQLRQIRWQSGDRDQGAQDMALAWLALECPRTALRWIGDMPSAGRLRQELESTCLALRDARRDRFGQNLATIAERWPQLARALQRAQKPDDEVAWVGQRAWILADHPSAAACPTRAPYPCLVRVQGQRIRVRYAPTPVHDVAEQLRRATAARGIDGLRNHALIGDPLRFDAVTNVLGQRICAHVPGWQQRIDLVVPDLGAWARMLEDVDYRPALSSAGLYIHHELRKPLEIVEQIYRPLDRPLPKILAGLSPRLQICLDELQRQRISDHHARTRWAGVRWGRPDNDQILDRLARSQPLRIWMWSSRFTTVLAEVARDLSAAFEELGHECRLEIETDSDRVLGPHSLSASIAEFEPDFVLLLDHVRGEYGSLFPVGLPVVSWMLDDLPGLYRQPGPSRTTDIVFTWSRAIADQLDRRGWPGTRQLAMAVNTAKYEPQTPAKLCPTVAFPTHLRFPGDAEGPPGLWQTLRDQFEQLRELPTGSVEIAPWVERTARELGVRASRRELADWSYQANLISRNLDRIRIADALDSAGIELALYGHGWAELPRFARAARGIVAPGPALAEVYRKHRAVVHVNRHCNVHMRVLEAMSCGGFVLARSDGPLDKDPGGLSDFFDLDREICLWSDTEDLRQKLERAEADPDWRAQWIRAGMARVRGDHSYAARARQIITTLEQRLRSDTPAAPVHARRGHG